jgi:ElaB/YqjD/DUF883 family membrane-anchored ribosome-binding protein
MSEASATPVRSKDELLAALKLLDSAAHHGAGELRELMVGKYDALKQSLEDSTTLHNIKAKALEAKQFATEKAQKVDQNVHDHPYYYVAGAAVGGLLLGFILGRSRH